MTITRCKYFNFVDFFNIFNSLKKFDRSDFIDKARKYNTDTERYLSSEEGKTEQLARKNLKIDFQNCKATCENLLKAVDAIPNSKICQNVKDRIRYEWIYKWEKGIEQRSKKPHLSLNTFIENAENYSRTLTQAMSTEAFTKWRSSLKAFKGSVQEATVKGLNPQYLLEVLANAGIKTGPAVGKIPYWEQKDS